MKISIYNPDSKNFSTTYDVNGNRQPVTFTVPARDHIYFEKQLGLHIANALADYILNKRGTVDNQGIIKSPHDIKKEILKEILSI